MSNTKSHKRLQVLSLLALITPLLAGCVNVRNPDGIMYRLFVPPINWLIETFASLFAGNYGIAVILVVCIVRLVLTPLMLGSQKASIRQTVIMNKFKPQMDRFSQRVQEAQQSQDQEAMLSLQREQMAFFQQVGLNPLGSLKSGCLPLLIQFPIITALYAAVYNSDNISSYVFLGIRLGDRSLLIGVLTMVIYIAQSFISVMSVPKEQRRMMAGTMFMMPLMALFFTFSSPAGLMLYFLTSAIWSVGQMLWTTYIYRPRLEKKVAAEVEAQDIHISEPTQPQRPRRNVTNSASTVDQQKDRARQLNDQKRHKK
ncbi:MAG: membrane protein insertase YidC [Aerococcus sp.]|nr:membrane protein insertase YidC [Aerococcus sp.]